MTTSAPQSAWLNELIETTLAWVTECRAMPRADWAAHIALCNATFIDPHAEAVRMWYACANCGRDRPDHDRG
jgi:hypothetical protein